MKCPVCNDVRMREVEKDGVLIDVCPDCKGVWLDRGELEKLMQDVKEVRQEFNEWYYDEKRDVPSQPNAGNAGYPPPPQPPQQYGQQQPPQQYGQQQPSNYGYGQHPHGYHPKHKKKKSVLDVFGDLFE